MNTDPASSPSKRPQIPTRLLVHALVRENGTVDAGELYTVADELGMTGQQIRLCVKRLVTGGQFVQDGRGRKALLRAVSDVTGSVVPNAAYVQHAYRQDRGQAPWDGTWHLFAFAIAESHRTARDTLRDTLLRLGAAPVQSGLYVTANAVEELVEAQARHLGVLARITLFTSTDLRFDGCTDPPELAAALWPLREIADRHVKLAAFAEDCLTRLRTGPDLTGTQQLTMAVELAAEFSRAMKPDPLLPHELLPQPWPGSRARRLSADCWTQLRQAGPAGGAAAPRLFTMYAEFMS